MTGKKVVYLPLDERPCNERFPKLLFQAEELDVVSPKPLGNKKIPADTLAVADFLRRESRDADYAVIAMDMLLYGGLLPSRLHHDTQETLEERLGVIREIRQANPGLKLYLFQCIMRCPRYSSDDEEPDYYAVCGSEIHQMGVLQHKKQLGMDCEYRKDTLLERMPQGALDDYLGRRRVNLQMNLSVLQMAAEGIIDFLVLPQDDSAPYGYTAMDQHRLRERIRQLGLSDRVCIYPGLDELGLTMLCRVRNDMEQKTPRVYVKYASLKAPFAVPLYEDRALGETVKYQLMAAGCLQCASETGADLILAVSAPADNMQEARDQPADSREYNVERSLAELMYAVKKYVEWGIPVTIADNAYANGGELEIIGILDRNELLLKIAGYAGWNTSSNTIGTAVAQGVKYLYDGDSDSHRNFLLLRYLEDVGYCCVIRREITDNELPRAGMNYFDVREETGIVSDMVKDRLERFVEQQLGSISRDVTIHRISMPWRRMFEVHIEASCRQGVGGLI